MIPPDASHRFDIQGLELLHCTRCFARKGEPSEVSTCPLTYDEAALMDGRTTTAEVDGLCAEIQRLNSVLTNAAARLVRQEFAISDDAEEYGLKRRLPRRVRMAILNQSGRLSQLGIDLADARTKR